MQASTTPKFQLQMMGLAGRVDFMRAESLAYLADSQRKGRRFGAIFIDGWHRAGHVSREIVAALGVIEEGGLILCHDVADSLSHWGLRKKLCGPKMALDRIRMELPLETIRLQGSLAAIVNQPDD